MGKRILPGDRMVARDDNACVLGFLRSEVKVLYHQYLIFAKILPYRAQISKQQLYQLHLFCRAARVKQRREKLPTFID